MNRVAFGENRRPLDAVLQLADVAGPRVREQLLFGCRRERERPLVQLAAEAIDEVSRQGGDVLGALAQRRNHNRKHRQAEKEILAVMAGRDRRFEVAIRRGHDAHVDFERQRAADALELFLLERAEDLRL